MSDSRTTVRKRMDDVPLTYPAEAFPDMERLVKPLAHGYLRADLVSNVNHALEGMRTLAHANGYELEDALVFADHDAGATEFAALRHELDRTEARAVFVPSRRHLTDRQVEQLRKHGTSVWSTCSQTCWPAMAIVGIQPQDGIGSCVESVASTEDFSNEAQRSADRLVAVFRREQQSGGD